MSDIFASAMTVIEKLTLSTESSKVHPPDCRLVHSLL